MIIKLSFESRVALNPGLGGMRDVASAVISHEQTQYKTESAVFKLWMLYFQRISFQIIYRTVTHRQTAT